MKDKKRIVIYQTLIILAGICVSVYYAWSLGRVSIPFHSDDAGSTFEILNKMYFGTGGNNNPFDLFGILTNFSVLLFGINEFSTLFPFYLSFFLRFFLTCNILTNMKQDKFSVFFLKISFMVWCCAMPGIEGNAEITTSKFHIGPSIIILLIILIHRKIKNVWIQRVSTVLLLLLAMLQTDWVLSAIVCVIPVVLFYLFRPCMAILRDGYLSKRKQFLLGFLVIFVCFACGALNIWSRLSGHNLSSSGIYGSRFFSSLQEIINNSSVFFQGIFGMFNCQIVSESIISVLFIPRFIKCVLLCATMVYIIYYLVRCMKQKEFDEVRLLMCIVSLITFLAFIMTGSQHGQISIRYCNIMLFIFPVMAWYLLESCKIWKQFQYGYKVALLVVLCIAQLNIADYEYYRYDDLAEKLQENGADVVLAPYWSSTVVTVVSEGAVLAQPCLLYGDNRLRSFMNELGLYEDKAARFYTVIVSEFENEFYLETSFNMTEERITEAFGDPEDILNLDEHYDLYIYDYDLRTSPQKFEKAGEDKYCLEGPFFGEYRIDTAGFPSDALLFPKEVNVTAYSESEEGSTYLLQITERIDELVIEVKEDSLYDGNGSIVLKRIWEAGTVTMQDGSLCSKEQPYIVESGEAETKPVTLKAGCYKLVLYGEDLTGVSVSSDCTMDYVSGGLKRLVYRVYAERDTEVDFVIHSQEKTGITNVSIEVCTE